jgi:gelsolin
MLKPKQYNVADSNLALFGTDIEREVKKAAAEHEDQWKGLAGHVGLHIWRIEKFHVVPWPQNKYGQFFKGDSYIVLNGYKVNDLIKYDVHFWLGSETTQDEAGTAAYKTVELDTLLDDAPIQHREVEGFESELFHSYFPQGIHLLAGGIESGFNHVSPETYSPRLLHLRGTFKSVAVHQVPLEKSSLNSSDVFILDLGLKIIQWNGSKSNGAERIKGSQISHAINEERNGHASVAVVSEGDSDPDFWNSFGGEGPIAADFTPAIKLLESEPILSRLSDASGTLTFTEVARGQVSRNLLSSEDVFVLYSGSEIFAWVGKATSANEKKLAVEYAQQFLHAHNFPPHTPITRILEGAENSVFNNSFDK